MKDLCVNKKAFYDYTLLEKFEAGFELQGTEVKSLKAGKGNLKDSYAIFKNNEIFLLNMHISPYSHGNISNHEPERTRKLLLKRREINKLIGKVKERGLSIIPIKVYVNERSLIKVEIALAKGKRQYDKREKLRDRDMKRDAERAIKDRY